MCDIGAGCLRHRRLGRLPDHSLLPWACQECRDERGQAATAPPGRLPEVGHSFWPTASEWSVSVTYSGGDPSVFLSGFLSGSHVWNKTRCRAGDRDTLEQLLQDCQAECCHAVMSYKTVRLSAVMSYNTVGPSAVMLSCRINTNLSRSYFKNALFRFNVVSCWDVAWWEKTPISIFCIRPLLVSLWRIKSDWVQYGKST